MKVFKVRLAFLGWMVFKGLKVYVVHQAKQE